MKTPKHDELDRILLKFIIYCGNCEEVTGCILSGGENIPKPCREDLDEAKLAIEKWAKEKYAPNTR